MLKATVLFVALIATVGCRYVQMQPKGTMARPPQRPRAFPKPAAPPSSTAPRKDDPETPRV